jgi:hypothetical protein
MEQVLVTVLDTNKVPIAGVSVTWTVKVGGKDCVLGPATTQGIENKPVYAPIIDGELDDTMITIIAKNGKAKQTKTVDSSQVHDVTFEFPAKTVVPPVPPIFTPVPPHPTPILPHNPWQAGSFYLVAFVVLLVVAGVGSIFVPWYAILAVIVLAFGAVGLIGALTLKADERLSEKGLLEIFNKGLAAIGVLKIHGDGDHKPPKKR